jgi:hypothetical protein
VSVPLEPRISRTGLKFGWKEGRIVVGGEDDLLEKRWKPRGCTIFATVWHPSDGPPGTSVKIDFESSDKISAIEPHLPCAHVPRRSTRGEQRLFERPFDSGHPRLIQKVGSTAIYCPTDCERRKSNARKMQWRLTTCHRQGRRLRPPSDRQFLPTQGRPLSLWP